METKKETTTMQDVGNFETQKEKNKNRIIRYVLYALATIFLIVFTIILAHGG